MKTFIGHRLLLSVVLGFSMQAAAAEVETVVNPQNREEILGQAKNLLAVKTLAPAGEDPFHREAPSESSTAATTGGVLATTRVTPPPAGPRSTRDLLQAIATSPALRPSGYFVLGGQPTLVFGQKRVKAGNPLTITFEGVEYTLEVVSIERPNFTLRLNREEFTRTIK